MNASNSAFSAGPPEISANADGAKANSAALAAPDFRTVRRSNMVCFSRSRLKGLRRAARADNARQAAALHDCVHLSRGQVFQKRLQSRALRRHRATLSNTAESPLKLPPIDLGNGNHGNSAAISREFDEQFRCAAARRAERKSQRAEA